MPPVMRTTMSTRKKIRRVGGCDEVRTTYLSTKNGRGDSFKGTAPQVIQSVVLLTLHYDGHALLRLCYCLGWILVVLQLSGEVGIVGTHVEVAVTAQVEEDDAGFTGLF